MPEDPQRGKRKRGERRPGQPDEGEAPATEVPTEGGEDVTAVAPLSEDAEAKPPMSEEQVEIAPVQPDQPEASSEEVESGVPPPEAEQPSAAVPVVKATAAAATSGTTARTSGSGGGSKEPKGASGMPTYRAPGVYVEEIPSQIKAIVGVGTSTAAFIGIAPDRIEIPDPNPDYDPRNPAAAPAFVATPFPMSQADVDAITGRIESLEKAAPAGAAGPAGGPADARRLGEERRARTELQRLRTEHDRAVNLLADGRFAARPGEVKLCTSFTDFVRYFGEFSTNDDHRRLAHGVFGFFNNGGRRCYVMRQTELAALQDPTALRPLEAIDEIAIVAAPGIVDLQVQHNVLDHCENMEDRFAVLDSPLEPATDETVEVTLPNIQRLPKTTYGAVYFPYLRVFDIAQKRMHPETDGIVNVAPSGFIAGIYARIDNTRGVHKAPAGQEAGIRGALDVTRLISRNMQEGLNPDGINCIRKFNGSVTVWGARTNGGDQNNEFKYISVRRFMLFLKESIDEGTQWVVFEPNDEKLWAKIVLNVTAFLTLVWKDGALFGSTPAQAFYVKCDEETNPHEVREQGRVVTEIGVAIVRPAEFVIFRVSQVAGRKPS